MRRYSILPGRSERFEVDVGGDHSLRPYSSEVDVGAGVGPVASEAQDHALVELAATDALYARARGVADVGLESARPHRAAAERLPCSERRLGSGGGLCGRQDMYLALGDEVPGLGGVCLHVVRRRVRPERVQALPFLDDHEAVVTKTALQRTDVIGIDGRNVFDAPVLGMDGRNIGLKRIENLAAQAPAWR